MPAVDALLLGPYPDASSHTEALELDAIDPLRPYRDRFVNTDPDLIYLDGNSLGRLPSSTPTLLDRVTNDQWGGRLIRAWNEGWWDLGVRLGDRLAPLIGARQGEVIISESTTVNLYKLAMGAVTAADHERTRIVTDDLNFPSDAHVLAGVARATGRSMEIVTSDGIHGPLGALARSLDDHTALVSLSHTAFKSGYTYDLAELTRMAHSVGALILWDCSHSVGAVPIDLGGAGADLAVGCTYKYLNGGPGSPAFLYVREDLQPRLTNPIQGWWGHADPFGFQLEFAPVSSMRRFHSGTMPILSLAAVEAGLEVVLDAGMPAIRTKSIGLSTYLIEQHRAHLEPLGFTLASPAEAGLRGSHVSLGHPSAWPITRALVEEAKVIPDYRTPDSLRIGLSPLYTSFVDIHTAVQRVKRVVEEGNYHAHIADAATVT